MTTNAMQPFVMIVWSTSNVKVQLNKMEDGGAITSLSDYCIMNYSVCRLAEITTLISITVYSLLRGMV